MPSSIRSIIVHIHMLKNAGSTFDWSLKKSFGVNFYDALIDQHVLVDNDLLTNIVKTNKNIQAITSHHIVLPLPIIENVNLLPALLIRHPLLRAVSAYEFERRHALFSDKSCEASKMTLSQYIEWRLDEKTPPIIRNCQTRYCSGMIGQQSLTPLDQSHYEVAVNYLQKNLLVGVVEQYDKSMVVFSDYCRDVFNNIDFSYIKKNVGSATGLSEAQKLEALKNELGASLYQALSDANQHDLLLFEQAKQIVEERFLKIKNAHLKMNILRLGNALLPVQLKVSAFIEKVKRNIKRRLLNRT